MESCKKNGTLRISGLQYWGSKLETRSSAACQHIAVTHHSETAVHEEHQVRTAEQETLIDLLKWAW